MWAWVGGGIAWAGQDSTTRGVALRCDGLKSVRICSLEKNGEAFMYTMVLWLG